jgi:hypothetical protein
VERRRVDGETGRARAGHKVRAAGPSERVLAVYGHATHGFCRGWPEHGGRARSRTKRGKEVGRPSGSGVGASVHVRAKQARPRRVERERGEGGPAGFAGGPKGWRRPD